MKSLNEYIIEQISLPNKKWVDIDLVKLDAETMNLLWDMYTNTYLSQGIDLSAHGPKELQGSYKATWFIDVDKDSTPDAFIIYKETKHGSKIALLGTDGQRESKRMVIKKLFELLKGKGWYLEASLKIEEILSTTDINVVDDEQFVAQILKKEIRWEGNGYYQRKLKKVNKWITKRIYGNPKR